MEELTAIADGLRKRMMPIGVILVAGILITFPFLNRVIKRISENLLPAGMNLIQLEPLELILLEIKIAVVCGVLAALPLVLYYLVKVVNERIRPVDFNLNWGNIVMIVFFAIILFFIGASYSYFMMLPFFFNYVYQMALSAGVISNWSIAPFISFVVLMTAVFGIVFELPLILTLLVRGGVVEIDTLKKYRRHAYVALLILASLITSPDIFTQVIIGGPLIMFYEISIFVAQFASRDKVKYDNKLIGDYAFKSGLVMGAGMILGTFIIFLLSLASDPQSILGFVGENVPLLGLLNLQQMIALPLIIPTVSGTILSLRARKIGDVSPSEHSVMGKNVSIIGILSIIVSATLWAIMLLGTLFTIGDPINIPGTSQQYSPIILLFMGIAVVASFFSVFITSYHGSNLKSVIVGIFLSASVLAIILFISSQLALTTLLLGLVVVGVISILCGYTAKLSFVKG
ncbi:MAG: twin-arginine translocase subunit TatC [Halobacteriota archaeon]|nr:twin-arginine translocase subunit TatC [Halobacteriota archaeon]